MYIYGWVALLWTWNYDNIVYQLYSNAKLKVKKKRKKNITPQKEKTKRKRKEYRRDTIGKQGLKW